MCKSLILYLGGKGNGLAKRGIYLYMVATGEGCLID